jgi:DNA repair photolyase
VPPLEERIATFKNLSSKIEPKKVIWRYDPIIISSITPINYHLEKIYNICKQINGYTNRLIISFLDFYGKVKKRLEKIGHNDKIEFIDVVEIINRDKLLNLAENIKNICIEFNMKIHTCAEIIDLDKLGIQHGKCIDDNLMRELFGLYILFKKDKNQRKECLCVESVDIGFYDTCQFQCNYCYANSNLKKIKKNVERYNVDSPSLIEIDNEIWRHLNEKKVEKQFKMF